MISSFFSLLRRWWLAIVVVIILAAGLWGNQVSTLLEALEAPVLPEPSMEPVASWQPQQNWTDTQATQFHYESQGSRTFNIPLSWFLALEAPAPGTVSFLLSEQERFSGGSYLSRFGFVPQNESANNPYGLPIGFATTPYQNLIGIEDAKTAIGLTCAACHTGQLIHNDHRYLIQGGSAMVDLGRLTTAIGAALGQTEVAANLPVLGGRFERFARRVLNDQYDAQSKGKLKADLKNVVVRLASQPMGIDVTEGFGRLDALNRIGNQVFALDPGRDTNYVNINSPVDYPPIWTSSWFDWVQYDGSIMEPLVRNAGEAMGTAAHTDFFAPLDEGRFSTAVPMRNLDWIESQLAGPNHPMKNRGFSGLHAPSWPAAFGEIDPVLAADGEVLYEQHCAKCHRPALTKAVERGNAPDSPFWDHFKPITWWEGETLQSTQQTYLNVAIVHQDYVGTDPGQGRVLADRTIDTSSGTTTTGKTFDESLGINTSVCVKNSQGQLVTVNVNDSPMLAYPIALGAVVQLGIDQWMAAQGLDAGSKNTIQGDRPNCLQAGQGYKARPLNGIWSTPPFLHNGSIPSMRQLLGPLEDRPAAFAIAKPVYDPVNMGIVVKQAEPDGKPYAKDGSFVLNTAIAGNSNRGHEFTDTKRPGRIGPALSSDEIDALIEFLKTL